MKESLINFKSPDIRHFYAYQHGGEFISGLNVDSVNIENTIIVPTDDIDEDLKVIDEGLVKPKELIYFFVRSIPMLNTQITINVSLMCVLIDVIYYKKYLTFLIAFFFDFIAFSLLVFAASWIVKKFYYFIGETRARLSSTVFTITLLVTLLPICSYGLKFVQKWGLFSGLIYSIFSVLAVLSLITFLTNINIKSHPEIKKEIKYEWKINSRVYGTHFSENENDKPVLYPKSGRSFYTLNPIEYRTLVAYQQTRGDRQKAKELMTSWHTKPLVTEKIRRLWSLEQFNLPRRGGIFLFRIGASLLCIFLKPIAEQTKVKYWDISVNWLKMQGINRVFWIYQECEAGLKRLSSMQEI
ncbi:MAG: hypothetical protein V7K38_14240 [Nostoc sp.]|uniref:hypothetical protein n=1 Tax=Nostoc sp. TaxID=1180 RepID=UPI002FFA09E5